MLLTLRITADNESGLALLRAYEPRQQASQFR